MQQRIIYENETGIAVIIPSDALPVEEVARKDVPAGVPYLIINVVDIPEDRTFRNAWTADFTTPHGVGIGADAWFEEQAAIEAERHRLAAIEAERIAAEQEAARLEAEAALLASRTELEQQTAPLQFDGIQGATE